VPAWSSERSPERVRVIPSWTEPAVTAASTLIGGPLGRHATVGRSRFWTPLRVLLLGAILVLAAGWLVKAPCLQQMPNGSGGLTLDWRADRQYTSMCYSDIVTLYGGTRPDYLDYPVVTALVLTEAARLTRHYEDLTRMLHWLPTGLPEVVFFDLLAVLLAGCWLVVVWAVRRARPHRPWDAALVALSPLAWLHVFTGLDALAVAAATGGLLAFSRRRSALAGALLAVAAAAKLYAALLLIPLLLIALARESGLSPGRVGDFARLRRSPAMVAVLAAVLTWLMLNLPVLLVTRNWLRYFRDGIKDGPGPDSLYYVISYFTPWRGFDDPAAAQPRVLNGVVLGLIVLAVLGLVLLTRLAPRPPRLASLCFLLVAAVLLVNKSWSPQFSLWLVPLAVLALPRWRLLATWMVADALVWVPRMFYYLGVDNKGLPPDPFLATVLVRDALVLLIMVLVVRSILRPETDPVRLISYPTGSVRTDDPDWPSS
jgi:uncharacterized membrane protein